MKVRVDEAKCIGCGTCATLCEQCFELVDGISRVKAEVCDSCDLNEVASSCPVGAISVEESKEPEEDPKA